MKKEEKKSMLSLGKELSKNEQKKILGGATVVCRSIYWPYQTETITSSQLNCGMAAAYCQGRSATLVSCSN